MHLDLDVNYEMPRGQMIVNLEPSICLEMQWGGPHCKTCGYPTIMSLMCGLDCPSWEDWDWVPVEKFT